MFPAGHVGNNDVTIDGCGGAVVADFFGVGFAGGAAAFTIAVDVLS